MPEQKRCVKCDGRVGPKAKVCPYCGHKNPTVEPSRLMMLLAMLAAFLVLLRVMNEKPPLPAATQAEASDQAASRGDDPSAVLSMLRLAYPELADERLTWIELSGRRCLAMPDAFWRRLRDQQKLQLVRELDLLFDTRNWQIVCGPYLPDQGKVTPEETHPRSELLVGF